MLRPLLPFLSPSRNHAGTKSGSRQSGCFPSNWCGSGEDDAFDEAEAKDRARKAKLLAAQQTSQPTPIPTMSRPSDATTAVVGGSSAFKGDSITSSKTVGDPPTVSEIGGGLAMSPVVQSPPIASEGEGLTREELQASKEGALLVGVVVGGGLGTSKVVQGLQRSEGGEGVTRE